jgi:hypothetical protein
MAFNSLCCTAGGDGPLSRKGSLLHLVDRSATAAGGRLLRRWLAAPLADRTLIVDRQDAVQVRGSLRFHCTLRCSFCAVAARLADRTLIANRQDAVQVRGHVVAACEMAACNEQCCGADGVDCCWHTGCSASQRAEEFVYSCGTVAAQVLYRCTVHCWAALLIDRMLCR